MCRATKAPRRHQKANEDLGLLRQGERYVFGEEAQGARPGGHRFAEEYDSGRRAVPQESAQGIYGPGAVVGSAAIRFITKKDPAVGL